MDAQREQQFEQLYRSNYVRLYRYALNWLDDEEEAKDVVSSLFSDLWDNQTVLLPETVSVYLARSVKNRCITLLRRKSVNQKAVEEMIANRQALIADTAEQQDERMEKVTQVMDGMNTKMRFVVEQHYIEGKKYSELADIMGTTSGMIHKYVSGALALFRKKLIE